MEFKDLRQFQTFFLDFRCPKLYNPGDSGHSSLESTALLVLGHVWSSNFWNLQYLGSWMHGIQEVVAVQAGNAWKNAHWLHMDDCFCLHDFLQALCFETWHVTSGHVKWKIGVFDGGKRFPTSLWSSMWCDSLHVAQRADLETMKMLKQLTFRGGKDLLRGGEQHATLAGSRKHLTTRPKMTRASIWPASAQDLRFRGVFVSKTPEITTFWWGYPVFWEGGVNKIPPRQDRETT